MSSENAEPITGNDTGTAECRACLQKLDTEQLFNLFQAWTTSWEGMKSTIAEDLSVLANVQLIESDKHSKLICSSCCSSLRNACKFKLLVQENDKILHQRYPEMDTEKEWPQPIQVETSITGLYNNPLQVEIKQEVLTDDENMGNGEEGFTSTNCVDMIKIEPEEIVEPVTNVPSSFRVTQINGEECLEEEDDSPVDSEMDQPIQDTSTKKDTENGTKQAALLTHADVMVAVAEALSKPVENRKEVQVTTPELDAGTQMEITISPNTNLRIKSKDKENPSLTLEKKQTNIDEKVQNVCKNPNDQGTVSQKTPNTSDSVLEGDSQVRTDIVDVNVETADGLKLDTGCEERDETTSFSDFAMEIEPTSPDSDRDDVEAAPVTTTADGKCEKVGNKNFRTTETIFIEVPPYSSDPQGLRRIVPIAKRVEVPTYNCKELKCTSKLATTKTEASNLNKSIDSETLVSKDPSLFTNLAMSSKKLDEKNVPKPACVTPEPQIVFTSMMNTNKELSQKLDSLSEKVATVVENQKVMADSQEKILAHIMGMSSQFEQLMKHSHNEMSPNVRTSSRLDQFMERCPSNSLPPVPVPDKYFFKPIENSEALQALDESLKDEAFASELKSRFLVICGVGNNKAGSICYLLLDLMFDRKFLTHCSWSGGSRDESVKLCFKNFKNVIHFFFSVIHATDTTYTVLECEAFFKRTLRNSLKRQAAKMLRASTCKRRRRRCDKSESDNDTPQQEIDESMFIKTLMAASGYETVRDVT